MFTAIHNRLIQRSLCTNVKHRALNRVFVGGGKAQITPLNARVIDFNYRNASHISNNAICFCILDLSVFDLGI